MEVTMAGSMISPGENIILGSDRCSISVPLFSCMISEPVK